MNISHSLLTIFSISLSLPLSLPPSLSPSHEGQVRHYHIKHEDAKYYISDKHRFLSIKKLIDYHRLNGGGLVTRLRKPPLQLLPQLNTLSPVFGRTPVGVVYFVHIYMCMLCLYTYLYIWISIVHWM